MTRRSFFCEHLSGTVRNVTLEGSVAHHITNVLRLQRGHHVELRDGKGTAYLGRIEAVGRGRVEVSIISSLHPDTEPILPVTLAVAYARGDKMDLVLRQGVELGISRFIAFPSQRSQYKLSLRQEQRRKQRWLKICQDAICQCGRTCLPEVSLFSSLEEILELARAWEDGDRPVLKIAAIERCDGNALRDLAIRWPNPEEIVAVVGCEGGWSEEEITSLEKAGFQLIGLGPRVLRLETASVALLAAIQVLWGDMGGYNKRSVA